MKKTKRIISAIISASIAACCFNALTADASGMDWVTLKSKSDSEILELYKEYCQEAGLNFSLYITDEEGNKVFTSDYYRWQARAAYRTEPDSATYIIELGKDFDVSGFKTSVAQSHSTDGLDAALFGFTGENNISCNADFNDGGTIILKFRDEDCEKMSIYEGMRRIMAIYYSDFCTEYRGDELYISEDLPAGDPSYVKGDANVDAKLNVADAVAVLQYITNNSKYPLGDVGIKLADVDGIEGVTGEDAIAIQKIDAITWDES